VSILRKSVVMTTSYCLFYSNSRCKICLIILSFYYLFAVLFFYGLWQFCIKTMFDTSLPQLFVGGLMSYLRYLLIASSVFATRTYISTLGLTTRSLPLESPSSGTYYRKTRKSFGASKQKVLNWIANIG
jgi:hypothetical protein